jgi:hypothetical protein
LYLLVKTNKYAGTLRAIVEWWTHHEHDKPEALQQALAAGEASDWDLRFFAERFGNDYVAEREALIRAANYLDCTALLEHACAHEANWVLGSQLVFDARAAATSDAERASVAAEQEWFARK